MSNIELDLVKTLAIASEDAYLDTQKGALILTPNYRVQEQFSDSSTGFSVLILKRDDASEYIFAFRGTEGSAQDWYTNLTLGSSQWNENKDDIFARLSSIGENESNAIIHFTGHSLGGALAQYAAYEYRSANGPLDFDLVTFNALGAELALNISLIQDIGYDASIANAIPASATAISAVRCW